MENLADLFSTYKPVELDAMHEVAQQQDTDFQLARLRTLKSRIKQIKDMSKKQDEDSEDEDIEENTGEFQLPDIQIGLESQPDDFKWFNGALREAWAEGLQTGQVPQGLTTQYDSSHPMAPKKYDFSGITPVKYNRGNLAAEIEQLFKQEGIDIRVTSGKRKAGAVGKAGNKSYHVPGNAVDIVPAGKETFDTIRSKMIHNERIMKFMYENGLGVLDETSASHKKATGATGDHYHIGPDQWALYIMNEWTDVKHPFLKDGYKPSVPYQRSWRTELGMQNTPQPSGKVNQSRQEWARMLYNAYYDALKKEYGSKYTDAHYKKIASYMTYQSALESGYGEHANGFNYAGHMKKGKTIHYSTLDDFIKAHIKTLKKWDFMETNSLKEYIDSLHRGQYKYCASSTPGEYYNQVNGTVSRVNSYLGMRARLGGKFSEIREFYGENFSKYRGQGV